MKENIKYQYNYLLRVILIVIIMTYKIKILLIANDN